MMMMTSVYISISTAETVSSGGGGCWFFACREYYVDHRHHNAALLQDSIYCLLMCFGCYFYWLLLTSQKQNKLQLTAYVFTLLTSLWDLLLIFALIYTANDGGSKCSRFARRSGDRVITLRLDAPAVVVTAVVNIKRSGVNLSG